MEMVENELDVRAFRHAQKDSRKALRPSHHIPSETHSPNCSATFPNAEAKRSMSFLLLYR